MSSVFSGTVDVPKVGPVKKPVLLGIAAAAAGFVGWRWWQARQAAAAEPGPGDPGFQDAGTLPAVAGAVPDDNSFGRSDGSEPASTDQFGFHGTTNSQWTQYASQQLSQQDRWDYATIVAALGNFIANKPLDATQQTIVQAAIALAGYPPEGSHVIVPGGEVPITVAPSGVKVTVLDTTRVEISWNAVPGAHEYRVYRSGVGTNVGSTLGPKITIGGLSPGNTYTFTVRGLTASGKPGPLSAGVKATTKNVTLKAPTSLHASMGRTSANLSWHTVSGADGYRMYRSGVGTNVGASGDGKGTVYGLKPNTTYTFYVRALDHHGHLGPASAKVRGKTRK